MKRIECIRQSMHLFVGALIIFLLAYHYITVWHVLIFSIVYSLLVFLNHFLKIPVLDHLLRSFTRKHENIAGISSFMYMLGVTILVLVFPENIYLPGLAIFVLGDGFSTIVGFFFGKYKLLWNKNKTYEGLFAGIITAFLGALIWVYWIPALIAAVLTMLMESVNTKYDDNVIVPVAAGLILFWLSLLI